MGLKFRRGTTAEKSGSLAFGEPYVNTTLGTLQIGGTTGDITLSTSGTGSTGNFGAISGSGLDITGNANVAGNLSVGGQLTIGDNTSDTVNVVASLSSSLIPQTDNVFDLGSTTKSWRDLYISTGSIKVVSNGEVVSTLSTNADGSQNFPNGLSVTGSLNVSGSVKIGQAGYIKDTLGSIHMYTSGANYNNGGEIQFGGISGSAATGVDNFISFNGAPTTQASNTSVTIWGDNSGGGAALFLNRKSSQGVESWGYSPWTIGVDLGATSTPNGLYIGTGNLFLSRSIEFNYKGLTPNILFSGSGIIPAAANTYDLGTPTKPWREIYVSTGSINFVSNGTVVSTLSTNADGSQNFPNGLSVTGSLKVSGSLVVSGSTSFNKKLKIGPDIGAGINSSFENALEIGSNPDVGLGGAMFLGNTIGSSTWGMLSNGSNNFAIANQSGFQSRAVTLYNTENKIEFLYSGSINANGSGFHNIRFDENGIIPYAANQYDLGSETNYFRDLYVSTGSIKIVANGSVVSSITTNADGSQNFQKGLNVSGSLIVTGSITATGDVVAYSTSDKRHKNNIVLISDALSKVTKLNGVTWEWNDDVDVITKETPKTGLIAQEVKEVLPEVVKEREDGFLALDYSKMMGLMVESIKELSAKIDRLENK